MTAAEDSTGQIPPEHERRSDSCDAGSEAQAETAKTAVDHERPGPDGSNNAPGESATREAPLVGFIRFLKTSPVITISATVAVVLAPTLYVIFTSTRPAHEAALKYEQEKLKLERQISDLTRRLENAAPVDSASRFPEIKNGELLRDAAVRAQELRNDIKAIDTSDGSLRYDKSIIDGLRAFYRSGSADAAVTREFCRDVVVAIIWDLFLMRVHDPWAVKVSSVEPGEEDVQNALDPESARLFRTFLLTDLLPTAPHDLNTLQQARLYRLAGIVLQPERDLAITVLNAVMTQFDAADSKRALVQMAIDDLRSK